MIRRLVSLYLKSWLLLLWSAFCVCAGAAWMLLAIVAELTRRGLL